MAVAASHQHPAGLNDLTSILLTALAIALWPLVLPHSAWCLRWRRGDTGSRGRERDRDVSEQSVLSTC